ncbi:MAG: tyrosine-type recombinase/integrase, partial [Alphaproteobacteria bacterium]
MLILKRLYAPYSRDNSETNLRLTDVTVKALKPPKSGAQVYPCDTVTGFGVRVSHAGTASYVLTYGKRRQRVTIGRVGVISLKDARAEAKRLLAEQTLGKQRPKRLTFAEACTRFIADKRPRNRPRTVNEDERILNKYWKSFHTEQLEDITTDDVLKIIDKLQNTPSTALHAFWSLRALFRWCVRRRYLHHSPMEGLQAPHKITFRERVLTKEELKAVYRTARAGTTAFHRIVSLLILTGQRRREISRLEWDWITDATITIPGTISKNRRTHTFPTSQAVHDVLESIPRLKDNPYVFPAAREQVRGTPVTTFNGWGKPKTDFDKECGVAGWTLHDLRRTFSSGMAALGVPQIVVEKILNHIAGGSLSTVAQIYNRYTYMNEMKAAMTAWEKHLDALLTQPVADAEPEDALSAMDAWLDDVHGAALRL